jgi:ankyrin repeat protein
VFGDKEVVKALIDSGADVNAKDKTGMTALLRAFLAGLTHVEISKILKEAGAK